MGLGLSKIRRPDDSHEFYFKNPDEAMILNYLV